MSEVLVLNADWQPLQRVTIRHAVRMLLRQVAEVHEAEPDRLIGVWPLPRVLRLIRYVRDWRHTSGPPWSRRAVLARDRHICGYCGRTATTVDHIQPRSRGGANSWANTVAACGGCNQRKRDLTPAEAGMWPQTTPVAPSWAAMARR